MNYCGITLPEKPLFQAPMEDVTDSVFLWLLSESGSIDFYCTEFVSSEGLIRNARKSVKKTELNEKIRPVAIQLYGNNPDSMAEAARIAEDSKPDVIDLNFGCPVKKIAMRGAGSGLMKDIPLMCKITEKVISAVKIPVTVKTRLGWDENTMNIEEVTLRLQDCGISAITIHGRTRSQMYSGSADWTLTGKVKCNPLVKIPVIGNGDIINPQTALDMFNKYNVDGIMIGRASIGRPWIFKHIRHFLNTVELLPEPSLNEKIAIIKKHLLRNIESKGEYGGILTIRRHYVQYLKGLPHSRELRIKLLTSNNLEENLEILDSIKDSY